MQEEYEDATLSISQRAYLNGKLQNEIRAGISLMFITLIGYLSIFLIYAYANGQDTLNVEDVLFSISIPSVGVIYYTLRSRKLKKSQKEWNEDYLQQSYILVFGTTVPSGATTGERILKLARAVFPELISDLLNIRADYIGKVKLFFKKKFGKSVEDINSCLNYKINSYVLDLALKTEEGYFIVKDFKDNIVTLEDLKQLVQIVSGKFKNRYRKTYIFRVICVAKQYNQSFLKAESLEEQIIQLHSNFPIDLLIEEKVGYSVLWVDH
jgi:hypothetical protein